MRTDRRQGEVNASRQPDVATDDAALVLLVQARGIGWKLVFNELLMRHRAALVGHCAYRLGNRQDAQDVVQQTLLRAWLAIDRFEGRSAFRTWLFSIAENQCRTFAVKRMRYVQSDHIEQLAELFLENNGSGIADDCARKQAVSVVLEELGDKGREVLLLRFFQDCSLEDIAQRLDISLSAAKMRLYRALEQFRVDYLRVVDYRPVAA